MQSILNRGHHTLDLGRNGMQLTRVYTMLIETELVWAYLVISFTSNGSLFHSQLRESKHRPRDSVPSVVRTWFCIGYRTNEDLLLLKHQLNPPFAV